MVSIHGPLGVPPLDRTSYIGYGPSTLPLRHSARMNVNSEQHIYFELGRQLTWREGGAEGGREREGGREGERD